MGQTAGGNAGNLELLKQMEEQRAEIEALKEVKKNLITITENEFYSIEAAFSFAKNGICFLYMTFFVDSVPTGYINISPNIPAPQQDFIVGTGANGSSIILETYVTSDGLLKVQGGEAGRRYIVNLIYPIKNIQED